MWDRVAQTICVASETNNFTTGWHLFGIPVACAWEPTFVNDVISFIIFYPYSINMVMMPEYTDLADSSSPFDFYAAYFIIIRTLFLICCFKHRWLAIDWGSLTFLTVIIKLYMHIARDLKSFRENKLYPTKSKRTLILCAWRLIPNLTESYDFLFW